jgi:hypothetical protein
MVKESEQRMRSSILR